jgi:hypothetical protein
MAHIARIFVEMWESTNPSQIAVPLTRLSSSVEMTPLLGQRANREESMGRTLDRDWNVELVGDFSQESRNLKKEHLQMVRR